MVCSRNNFKKQGTNRYSVASDINKMRSLTPNFRKTTFFVLLLGPNHTQPAKAGFVDICTPFPRPRQGGPPEKKYQMGSGLNQRDRGACGFVRFQTNRKPGKKNRRPGLFAVSGCWWSWTPVFNNVQNLDNNAQTINCDNDVQT